VKWVDRFADWYEQLPGWACILLFPVAAPLMLAYSLVVLALFLLFVLPYHLMFGSKQAENPVAKFTRAEVREQAESLDRWFAETLTKHPDARDCLGVGPEVAKQLVQLARQAELPPGVAGEFAERVGQELKGYKGIPFFALHHLSRRLAELANNERAA
jgi:hypothetical protein